jgi:hypothetical protein
MIARLLLLATLVNHAASFTKSDGVIELKNVAEFNKAVDEFDLLVVEFYAPVSTPLEPPCRWSPQRWPPVTTGPASQWCKACQKLDSCDAQKHYQEMPAPAATPVTCSSVRASGWEAQQIR